MADETKTNAAPEVPGGPPVPEQTEQAVIPGMDRSPAPSACQYEITMLQQFSALPQL